MKIGNFYLPAIGSKAELQQGMAGRRTDLYQRMLKNLLEQVQYQDAHGYWGVAFTEHHFHIEGEEVSNNPVLLDTFIGLQTKNLMVGQLGIVLPCANPLRVAEDIAMLDQMTQGRAFAGFARGYQPRWVNTLGQHYKGMSDSSDPVAHDKLRRELYEEHWEIIVKAWTNPTFSHYGKHWQIPPKNTFWQAHDVTRKYGRGVDENGMLLEVGTTPETYQKPHPKMFQPFSFSESSVKWATSHGATPVTIVCDAETCKGQFRAAQEGGASSGRNLKFGESVGITREIIVADTDAEALALGRESGAFIWNTFFRPFGFQAALARPGEDPNSIPATFEMMVERGLTIAGSPDTVNRKLDKLFKELPAEYFFNFNYNELLPQKAAMRSLELLTKQVYPNFSDTIR